MPPPETPAPAKWTQEPVFNEAGKRLVFDVEPCLDNQCDFLTAETLAAAFREVEMQVDTLEDEPDANRLQFTITPRWVTAEEWKAEQEEWVNGD